MKQLLIILCASVFSLCAAQNNSGLRERYEKIQPQDVSAPPPPITMFPATFPGGNKIFVDKIARLINRDRIPAHKKAYRTQITLKIDPEGNVQNISTVGNNKNFDQEILSAAYQATKGINWVPGKNKTGLNVVDIVRIPFIFLKK